MITMQANQEAVRGTNNGSVEEFVNKSEVARRLRRQVRTVDNWMRRGILPYYKIGRSVSFKWSEVEAHLRANYRVCLPTITK